MRAHTTHRFALILSFAITSPAFASHVFVPDDYASIQSAMDSGTDSVLVKDGVYSESLVMRHNVNVVAYVVPGLFHNPQIAAPQVQGFSTDPTTSVGGVIEGFRFRGPVALTVNCCELQFESCRFDSGVTTSASTGSNFATFRGCQFFLQCRISLATWEMVGCTVFGTGIDGSYEGYALIRDNLVVGPAAFGISMPGREGGVEITGNTVVGTTDGIVTTSPEGTYVADNEVRNCSGTAFRNHDDAAWGGFITYEGNRVVACGGRGIDVRKEVLDNGFSRVTVIGNTIDSVGSDGVYLGSRVVADLKNNTITHVGGNGFLGASDFQPLTVTGNRIVGTGLDGIAFNSWSGIGMESNVVGRPGGRGIVVGGASGWRTIRANTVYATGGSGFVVATHVDSVDHNIAYGSVGYGLDWSGVAPLYFGCNDWYGNVSGATSGIAPGATDLSVNPLFCDLPNDDVYLSAASPLASAPGCGLIGALGIGCVSSVSVGQSDAIGVLTFAALPSPSRGHVTFAIRGLNGGASVEVFDLAGARRWQAAWPAGQRTLEWSGADATGQQIAPGVYYARLTSGAIMRTARVIVLR